MKVIRSAAAMARAARRLERQGKRVGFVPTMGALHEGHASLILAAGAQTDTVLVSVFVNPLQFGPGEDFRRYPRPWRADLRAARAAGADLVFAPSREELYPRGFQTRVQPGLLAERWEGQSRPGHFTGVATVVSLLLLVTRPTHLFVGQKDYQQALIIRQLVRDFHLPARVHIMPTVREPDGLALSSRNAYLSRSERAQAAALFLALTLAADRIREGERRAEPLLDAMRRVISEAPDARVDYVAVVDADTLAPLWRLQGRAALLVAAWVGRTRLIDNLLVDVS